MTTTARTSTATTIATTIIDDYLQDHILTRDTGTPRHLAEVLHAAGVLAEDPAAPDFHLTDDHPGWDLSHPNFPDLNISTPSMSPGLIHLHLNGDGAAYTPAQADAIATKWAAAAQAARLTAKGRKP